MSCAAIIRLAVDAEDEVGKPNRTDEQRERVARANDGMTVLSFMLAPAAMVALSPLIAVGMAVHTVAWFLFK